VTDPTSPAAPAAAAVRGLDRRGYGVALVTLMLGAVLLLVACGRTWSTASVGGAGLPTITVILAGSDLIGGVAVAVLALAGVAGIAATRRPGRIVIGLLLVLAGLGVSTAAGSFALHRDDRLEIGNPLLGLVSERAGVDAQGSVTTVTSWWVGAVVAGLLIAVGGVLAVVRSGRWPEMGRRYERPDETTPVGSASGPASAWDQLDPTDHGSAHRVDDTTTDPTLRAADDA
jgi:uncharacterized membrane protein (TIGR02234 family)